MLYSNFFSIVFTIFQYYQDGCLIHKIQDKIQTISTIAPIYIFHYENEASRDVV